MTSRRAFLKGAGVLGLAFAARQLAACDVGDQTLYFDQVGVVPSAAAQPTAWGRSLQGITAHDGLIHGGYGDWNTNTGPIRPWHFNPATGQVLELDPLPTECFNALRVTGGQLLAVSVDPIRHDPNGHLFTWTGDAWADEVIAPMEHVHDVAQHDGRLFVCGATAATGVVLERADEGWTTCVLPHSPSGFDPQRVCWLAEHEGVLRAGYQFDWTLRLSDDGWILDNSVLARQLAGHVREADGQLWYLDSLENGDAQRLRRSGPPDQLAAPVVYGFDVVGGLPVWIADGALHLGASMQRPCDGLPSAAHPSCLTMADGYVYVGGSDSTIYRAELATGGEDDG